MTPRLPRHWWPAGLRVRADLVLAAALVALAMIEIWLPDYAPGVTATPGPRGILTATALLTTAPVALRRRAPLVAFTCALAGPALQARLATPVEGLAEVTAMLACAYAVGRHASRTEAFLAAVVAVVLLGVAGENSGDWTFGGLLLGAGSVAGLTVRRLQRRSEDLEARTHQLARERDDQARLAVANERTRIARELHDIVAHSVTTMVIQAQAGSALLDQRPDRARQAFEAIDAGGRQALTELRNLLGMLRDLDEHDSLRPQPTLEHLHEVIRSARGTGLEVDLHVDGEVGPVPPGLGLAVYRIVQEGLTNTIKHARATHASVRIQYLPDSIDLEVADNGTSTAEPRPGGHGLVGMRERAGIYHGSVVSGPRPEGGYLVRVRLPLNGTGQ